MIFFLFLVVLFINLISSSIFLSFLEYQMNQLSVKNMIYLQLLFM